VSLPGVRSARAPERALRSGHHGLAREIVASTQRERIVDAFVQVVAERGYQRTTVIAVCKQAGVSSKTFYVHFADKQDCFLSAFDQGVEALMGGVTEACRQEGPWVDRMRAGLSRLVSDLARAPAFARMAVVEVNAAGPDAVDRLSQVLSSLGRFFDDATWDEHLPDVKDSLVPAVVGGVYTRIYRYIMEGMVDRLPELVPVLMYFVVLPFAGGEVAAAELMSPPAPVATTGVARAARQPGGPSERGPRGDGGRYEATEVP
jgi:AcrR family transcriptional regulator